MAKKSASGVNKSKEIRDYYAANPKAKPKEIVEAMAEKGINVSAQYVSTIRINSKKKSGKKTGKKRGRPVGSTKGRPVGRPAGRPAGRPPLSSKSTDMVNVDALLAVKKMVEQVGGIDQAKSALNALEKLTR
ncbi:hypothetical protein [Stieleria varia]|uniref:Uncharacterized protein n=1 Tax=Stieleria varia TaxID=2528005 RepID=A0A5C6AGL5_9BACT|nr:hypothetical protein [Stieleria varia]TWT98590.1 hypothetical protein Pla52n_51070 [Stieleria varia]